jgi:hypothetical protein
MHQAVSMGRERTLDDLQIARIMYGIREDAVAAFQIYSEATGSNR